MVKQMIIFNYYGKLDNIEELRLNSLNGYTLTNLELHRLSYNDEHKFSFNNVNSSNASFNNVILRSVYFIDSNFEKCDFKHTKFYAFSGINTVFRNCSFVDVEFVGLINGCIFQNCNFSIGDWRITNFENCQFINVEFSQNMFKKCNWIKCTFDEISQKKQLVL